MLMLISGMFFGRAWCGWICPMAGLSEFALTINSRNVNVKKLRIIRYSIFTVWAGTILLMFIMAGGIKGVDPLRLTENGISVDAPVKYIIYYFVLAVFVILTLSLGKRGACHSICWMSPFLTGGYNLGKLLKIPQLRIMADSQKCVECGICNKKCPMSINICSFIKDNYIKTSDCILCGECVDGCRKNVLKYGIKNQKIIIKHKYVDN
ncbi:MAG: 4Fe-4S binding protein [Eubacteriales bacterium]